MITQVFILLLTSCFFYANFSFLTKYLRLDGMIIHLINDNEMFLHYINVHNSHENDKNAQNRNCPQNSFYAKYNFKIEVK